LPAGIEDETARGIGESGRFRVGVVDAPGKFVAGETVLVLGANGCHGALAVQIAKLLGAARVVGVGRSERVTR